MDCRRRSKNFTDSEVNLLVELVNKNKFTIECKETGLLTQKQKADAWLKLADSFKSLSGSLPRDPKVLKEKWANLKKLAVRNHAADKTFRKGTGGGPSQPAKESSTEAIINDILGIRMTGMANVCDGDFLETGNLMCNKLIINNDKLPILA
jgi:hypothetical protein